jgi:hypothetical protein
MDLISSGSVEGTSILLAVAALAGIAHITEALRLKPPNKDFNVFAASSTEADGLKEALATFSRTPKEVA